MKLSEITFWFDNTSLKIKRIVLTMFCFITVQQAFYIAVTVAGILAMVIMWKVWSYVQRKCLSDVTFRSPYTFVRNRRRERARELFAEMTPSFTESTRVTQLWKRVAVSFLCIDNKWFYWTDPIFVSFIDLIFELLESDCRQQK